MIEESHYLNRDRILAYIDSYLDNISKSKKLFVIRGYLGTGKSLLLKQIQKMAEKKSYNVIYLKLPDDVSTEPYYCFKWMMHKIEEEDKKYLENIHDMPIGLLPIAEEGTITSSTNIPMELSHLSSNASLISTNGETDYETENVIEEKIKNVASKKTYVFLIDDFQYADQRSIKFLDKLSTSLQNTPFAIFVAVRDDLIKETQKNLLRKIENNKDTTETIILEPFTYIETKKYIESMLNFSYINPSYIEWIYEKSGGIPFFIYELLNESLKKNVIKKKDGGRWVFTDYANIISTSDNIKKIFHIILNDLNKNETELLQYISISGKSFSKSILKKVMNGEDIDKTINSLEEKNIIKKVRGEVYSLYYPLMREVILDDMSVVRKRYYHKKFANIIESLENIKKAKIVYELALHFYEGNDWGNAYKYCLLAAQKADKALSLEMAIDYYRKALISLKEYQPSLEYESNIVKKLVDLTWKYGKWDDTISYANLLSNYGKIMSDEMMVGESDLIVGRVYTNMAQFAMAEEYLIEGINLFDKNKIYEKVKEGYCHIGYLSWKKGDIKKAEEWFYKALKINVKNNETLDGYAYTYFGTIELSKGNMESALNYFKKAELLLKNMQSSEYYVVLYNNIGALYSQIGYEKNDMEYIEKALYYFRLVEVLSAKYGYRKNIAWGYMNESFCYAMKKDFQRAIEANYMAISIMDELSDVVGIIDLYLSFAKMYELMNDLSNAEYYYKEGLSLAKNSEISYIEATASFEYGNFLLIKKEYEKSKVNLENAYYIYKKIGNSEKVKQIENMLEKIKQ
ncbi:MAG: hypothetical protein ACP5RS_05830 [Thermoplasmata archaeon]